MMTTTTSWSATTSTSNTWLPLCSTPLPYAFKPQRIKRDFPADWHQAIHGAYMEILGDAPPKRLNSERRTLMFALRRLLRTTSYHSRREE